MKPSKVQWMGNIPSAWKVIPIKYLFDIGNGTNPVTEEGPTPVYGSGANSFRTCEEFKEGPTVLLGRKGTVNIPQWIEGHYWNVDTAFDVKCKSSAVILKFLYYCAICFDYDYYATKTSLPSMTQNTYLNYRIPWITKCDQQVIVDYLDDRCSKVDEIIAEATASIEEYKELKQTVIFEAVTKGLDKSAPMKESGIEWVGLVPRHWEIKPNKYLMHKEKELCLKWNGEDIMSLTMKGVIVRDLVNPTGKMPESFDGYQYIKSGDLLMCLFDIDVTPRCVGRVFHNGITSPAYSNYKLHNGATLGYYYYYYLMVDNTKELLHLAKNLRHSFSAEHFGQLKAPCPPIDEQIAISTYLDNCMQDFDSLISEKQSLIDDLQAYKKALIYEVVTGKRRTI